MRLVLLKKGVVQYNLIWKVPMELHMYTVNNIWTVCVCTYVGTYVCINVCNMYECMHACMHTLTILGSHVKAPETWLSSIDCKHMQTPSIYPDIAQFKTFSTGISRSLGLPKMQLGWWTEPSLSFSPAFFWCSFHHQLLMRKTRRSLKGWYFRDLSMRECCYEMLWTKMEKNLFNQFGHLKIHQDPVDIP